MNETTGAFAFLALFTTLLPLWGWILFAVVTGVAAYYRGRDVVGWLALSLLFLGPFALLCVLVIGNNQSVLDTRALKKEIMKQCNTCAELVKPAANKCRYCGTDFTSEIES